MPVSMPRTCRCLAHAVTCGRDPEQALAGHVPRAQGVNGNKMEKACDLVHITLNKNAVVGDVSALAPGGVRIGAPAMTSRGLGAAAFEAIAEFLCEVRARAGLRCRCHEPPVHACMHAHACVLLLCMGSPKQPSEATFREVLAVDACMP